MAAGRQFSGLAIDGSKNDGGLRKIMDLVIREIIVRLLVVLLAR